MRVGENGSDSLRSVSNINIGREMKQDVFDLPNHVFSYASASIQSLSMPTICWQVVSFVPISNQAIAGNLAVLWEDRTGQDRRENSVSISSYFYTLSHPMSSCHLDFLKEVANPILLKKHPTARCQLHPTCILRVFSSHLIVSARTPRTA